MSGRQLGNEKGLPPMRSTKKLCAHRSNRRMLITGDCREKMKVLTVVDAIVCDPPYGLDFMGMGWDHGVPGVEYWKECLSVLKPGGYMCAFGGTRTWHRLTCAIEDAGFQIRDCLMWIYGSGFPKGRGCLKPAWEPIILARKPGKHVLPLGIEECRIPTGEKLIRNGTRFKDNLVYGKGVGNGVTVNPPGRWPANVILGHHPDCGDECHEDCPVRTLGEQSGKSKGKVAMTVMVLATRDNRFIRTHIQPSNLSGSWNG